MAGALAKVGIAGVEPRVMAAAKEIDGGVVKHTYHPLPERLEILSAPTVVVAHQLCSVCPLVTIDACGKRYVRVASKTFALPGPLHHNPDRCIGIGPSPANLPTQRILKGHGSPTCTVHIVLTTAATTNDSLRGPSGNARTAVFVGTEDFPSPFDACVATGQQLPGTVDVLL